MKNLRQLKDLIKNISRENNINSQILLSNYMLERLLERISFSDFSDKFILKGGMLIAALVGIDMRSTIDMDATIRDAGMGILSHYVSKCQTKGIGQLWSILRLRGMLPSRWFERKPITYLMGR